MKQLLVANEPINVVVVSTPQALNRGLLDYTSLPDGNGMFFSFPYLFLWSIHTFGMRFPIDILWLDTSGKIVCVCPNTKTNIGPLIPDTPTRYVLELPAGTVDKLKVKSGDVVSLPTDIVDLKKAEPATLPPMDPPQMPPRRLPEKLSPEIISILEKQNPPRPGLVPKKIKEVVHGPSKTFERETTVWVRPEEMMAEIPKTNPWNVDEKQFATNPPEGFRYDPNLGNEANTHSRRGFITVGPKFFALPLETRKAVVYHEIGHFLADIIPFEEVMNVADSGAMGPKDKNGIIWGINGQNKPLEIVAEAFSVYHLEPDFLKEKYPKLYDAVSVWIDKYQSTLSEQQPQMRYVKNTKSKEVQVKNNEEDLQKQSTPESRGLIPKKVQIHLPSGDIREGIRWTRPEESSSINISNTIKTILEQDQSLNIVVGVLSQKGIPYLVGGSIRDILLGIPPKDFDIEVHGISEEELQRTLQEIGAKHDQVGKVFGVYKYGNIDISLPRTETKTGEKHTDFDVQTNPNLNPKDAARRRDFRINGLMYSFKDGKLIDFFGGIEDLKNKTIRHIDDKTFIEDPLRVYRAAQFAARFGFQIHPDTIKLASQMDLSSLPKERINEEFKKMLLKSDSPSVGLQALSDMKVLERYFSEIERLKTTPQRDDFHAEGDVFIHTKKVLDKAANVIKRFPDEKDKITIMFATLVHDLGKPSTTKHDISGLITQHGHEDAGVEPAMRFLSKLTNEPSIINDVRFLVEQHLIPPAFFRNQTGDAAFRRLINKYGIRRLDLLAAVSEADSTGRLHKNPDGTIIEPGPTEVNWFRNRVQKVSEQYGLTQEGKMVPLVTGKDLIGLGYKEGPKLGQILRDIAEQQEEGKLTNKDNALKYVSETYQKMDVDWIENQKVAYHKHDGFPEHPVAVKHHQEYFASKTAIPSGNIPEETVLDKPRNMGWIKPTEGTFVHLSEITSVDEGSIHNEIELVGLAGKYVPLSHIKRAKLNKIQIKRDDFLITPNGQEAVGIYYGRTNTIELYQNATQKTIIHEIAHTLFPIISWEATIKIDKEYWSAKESGKGFPTQYSRVSVDEFFAESYVAFLTVPERFELRNKRMFDLMKQVFEEIENPVEETIRKELDDDVIYDPPGVGEFDPNLPDADYSRNIEKQQALASPQTRGLVPKKIRETVHGPTGTFERETTVWVKPDGTTPESQESIPIKEPETEMAFVDDVADENTTQILHKLLSEQDFDNFEKNNPSFVERTSRKERNFILSEFQLFKDYVEDAQTDYLKNRALGNLQSYQIIIHNNRINALMKKKIFRLSLDTDMWFVEVVAVNPVDYKTSTMGYGTQLMLRTVEQFLESPSATKIEVVPMTPHVRKYYIKFGFEEKTDTDVLVLDKEKAQIAFDKYKRFLRKSDELNLREELFDLEYDLGTLAGLETIEKQQVSTASPQTRGLVPRKIKETVRGRSGPFERETTVWVRPEETQQLESQKTFEQETGRQSEFDYISDAIDEKTIAFLDEVLSQQEFPYPDEMKKKASQEETEFIFHEFNTLADVVHDVRKPSQYDWSNWGELEAKRDFLHSYRLLVHENRVAAVARIYQLDNEFEVAAVAVNPLDYKTTSVGYGTSLMFKLLEEFLTSETDTMVVSPLNPHVGKYYAKIGFRPEDDDYSFMTLDKDGAKIAYEKYKRFIRKSDDE